jgi:MYXO-CTERM domain-containing protein
MRKSFMLTTAIIMLLRSAQAMASVTVYNQNKQAWMNAVGEHTTITFQGWPAWTNITTQYQSLGVTFTDGIDLIYLHPGFLNDGVGLYGAVDSTTIRFDQPVTAIAVENFDYITFEILWHGQVMFQSAILGTGSPGRFAGLTSTEPFDEVRFDDPTGGMAFDDLYFGPPIPGPGALPLVGLGFIAARSRRRRA